MAKPDRVLAIDVGAASLKVAEFEYPAKSNNIVLVGFAQREYQGELTERTRSVVVAGLLRQMLLENGFTAQKALISISGQSAFTRFVKLPPVSDEENRVRQIVEFEARQNVPFPIEEVSWDYQLIANPEAEELEVMFVVVKNEIVEQVTGAVQAVGLRPLLVDVAPAAAYNCARANNIGDDGCAMILNIGGRCTNLLFADRNHFFARTIPIAGHSITQQISKEFGIGLEEAEELKRRHGFVALGGAYAEPESEVAAAASKIIRNVMARLHGEINRSISVYRAQQKGNRPVKLFLCGGSSTMGYTDYFFSEKLRMEVAYLNPFQVVSIAPTVDTEKLQEVAHTFIEAVGLGLRYKLECPVQISLLPEAIRMQHMMMKKKPYVYACMVTVIVTLLLVLLASQRRAGLYRGTYDRLNSTITMLDRYQREIREEGRNLARAQDNYAALKKVLEKRHVWPQVLMEIENSKPRELWITKLQPVSLAKFGEDAPPAQDTDPRGGGMGGGFLGLPPPVTGQPAQQGEVKGITGFELEGHSVMLRTISGQQDEAGNEQLAPEQIFVKRLEESELFNFAYIKTYLPSPKIRNLSSFVIQLRLVTPIDL